MSVNRIPRAEPQPPRCSCCGGDTSGDFEYGYDCYDCGLIFDLDDLTASYSDPDAEPCGQPCDNGWHLPRATRGSLAFICHPCALPKGHDSCCWTGCERVTP